MVLLAPLNNPEIELYEGQCYQISKFLKEVTFRIWQYMDYGYQGLTISSSSGLLPLLPSRQLFAAKKSPP